MKFVITIFVIVAVSLLWFANEILPKEVNYIHVVDKINSKIISKMKKKPAIPAEAFSPCN